MKPVVTWIVLANARNAKVLQNVGVGKGVTAVSGKTWTAPEAELPRDNAGVGYSIAGPGRAAVEQTDPQEVIDENFAKTVIEDLSKAHYQKQFDRLILIAGPHMLGLLRAQIDTGLQRVLAGELSKDLLNQPDDVVESHIGELIAV